MPRSPASNRLGRFVREHERSLVAVSLVSLLLLGAMAAIGVIVRQASACACSTVWSES